MSWVTLDRICQEEADGKEDVRRELVRTGRGWAALNPDGTLEGHIYFHLGDDSAFRAERFSGVVQ